MVDLIIITFNRFNNFIDNEDPFSSARADERKPTTLYGEVQKKPYSTYSSEPKIYSRECFSESPVSEERSFENDERLRITSSEPVSQQKREMAQKYDKTINMSKIMEECNNEDYLNSGGISEYSKYQRDLSKKRSADIRDLSSSSVELVDQPFCKNVNIKTYPMSEQTYVEIQKVNSLKKIENIYNSPKLCASISEEQNIPGISEKTHQKNNAESQSETNKSSFNNDFIPNSSINPSFQLQDSYLTNRTYANAEVQYPTKHRCSCLKVQLHKFDGSADFSACNSQSCPGYCRNLDVDDLSKSTSTQNCMYRQNNYEIPVNNEDNFEQKTANKNISAPTYSISQGDFHISSSPLESTRTNLEHSDSLHRLNVISSNCKCSAKTSVSETHFGNMPNNLNDKPPNSYVRLLSNKRSISCLTDIPEENSDDQKKCNMGSLISNMTQTSLPLSELANSRFGSGIGKEDRFCQSSLTNANQSVKVHTDKDPVVAAMMACEAELLPLKQVLCTVKAKLRNLNIPELNCILDKSLHNLVPAISQRNVTPRNFITEDSEIVQPTFKIKEQLFANANSVRQNNLYNPPTFDTYHACPDSNRGVKTFQQVKPLLHISTRNNEYNQHIHSAAQYGSTRSFTNIDTSKNYYDTNFNRQHSMYFIDPRLSEREINELYDKPSFAFDSSGPPPFKDMRGKYNFSREENEAYIDDETLLAGKQASKNSKKRKCVHSHHFENEFKNFTESAFDLLDEIASEWSSEDETYRSRSNRSIDISWRPKGNKQKCKNSRESRSSQCPFLEVMKSIIQVKDAKKVSTFDIPYPGLENVRLKMRINPRSQKTSKRRCKKTDNFY